MATLSRKTLGEASRVIQAWWRNDIEQFFYEHGISNDLVVGTSKLAVVLNVFKALEASEEQAKLLELVEGAVARAFPAEARRSLEAALLRDGFAVSNGEVVESDPETTEQRTAVEVCLGKHEGDLDVEVLLHHWHESTDLFRQEKWDSSIGHCRNFVEQLLKDVAACIAHARDETPPDMARPVCVRQYLENVGFFDKAERAKLVDGVYGYFSEEGSHPGISTQSAARVANNVLTAFAFYLLEKFDAWKTEELTLS